MVAEEIISFIYSRKVISVTNTYIQALDIIGDKNLRRIKRLEIVYEPQGPRDLNDDTRGVSGDGNLEILKRRSYRNDISHLKSSPRYFRTMLNRIGTVGLLEKLVVKLMVPIEWRGVDVMKTRLAEVVHITQEFKGKFGNVEVEVRALSGLEDVGSLRGRQSDIDFEEDVGLTDTLVKISLD